MATQINLDSLSAFATNLLKDAAVWSRYWSEVLDCRDAAEVDELFLDMGYGQTLEY